MFKKYDLGDWFGCVLGLKCRAELLDNGIWDTSQPCIGITINQIIPVVGYDEVLNELRTLGKQMIASLYC